MTEEEFETEALPADPAEPGAALEDEAVPVDGEPTQGEPTEAEDA